MVSVIIAAFNADRFIGAAMESALSQKGPDFEIIVINDGSTDNTSSELDRYLKSFPGITVCNTVNSGLSHARNLGIEMAHGDYVMFLDADDALFPHALGLLRKIAKDSNADIVCSPLLKFSGKVPNHPLNQMASESGYTLRPSAEMVADILYQRGPIDNSMCGKLFKRNLFDDSRFREGTFYEDLDIFYRIFLKTKEIAVAREPVYLYRQYPNSFTHTFSNGRLDVLDVTRNMRSYMENSGDATLIAASKSRQLSANFHILKLLKCNPCKLEKERRVQVISECRKNIWELHKECISDKNMRFKNRVSLFLWPLFAHL